jgi:hypothetical protein
MDIEEYKGLAFLTLTFTAFAIFTGAFLVRAIDSLAAAIEEEDNKYT